VHQVYRVLELEKTFHAILYRGNERKSATLSIRAQKTNADFFFLYIPFFFLENYYYCMLKRQAIA
jgi:hypothetical protein